jgi:hypothetical protein
MGCDQTFVRELSQPVLRSANCPDRRYGTAALLTTGATLIIFEERFLEGAWAYFLFIPILYTAFTYFRSRIGAPSPEMDYLGQINSNLLAGFGFGQAPVPGPRHWERRIQVPTNLAWMPEPINPKHRLNGSIKIRTSSPCWTVPKTQPRRCPMAQFICEDDRRPIDPAFGLAQITKRKAKDRI